jgi:outer membrane lipoprotein-sorting protein
MTMVSFFRFRELSKLSICLVLMLFSLPLVAEDMLPGEDFQARSILEKADEIRFPAQGFQVDINITSTAPQQDDDKRKYRVLSKGNDSTVVMILEPASERGQIMLMKGRDLWVFMPNVSQPIRLGLAQRLAGQVANGDLARANFTGDYTPRLLRTENVGGEEQYVLELNAIDRGVTYRRVLYWVSKSSMRPRKAEFYSLSNRLMKTASYEDYQKMGGLVRPTRLVMEDALKKEHVSVLGYEKMQLRDLPDRVFTKDYLKKLQ